ncbi:ATP-binding protein [Brevibacterium otitidis]|uniref:ATP-binding protein n=1 Tax=Brevibacterium otitidis TaxID=53364 RepID=A0ABV5WZX2_9MICO|nr:ATP-binding protein [Brevibacterium otitidis]
MTITIPPPNPRPHPSPFRPSFGTTPAAVVGIQEEVNLFARALDGAVRGRATLVTGTRGVGKTVLLNTFGEVADSRQWVPVREQASPGVVQRLTEARLPQLLEDLDTAETTKSSTVGFTLPVIGGGLTTRTESTIQMVPDLRHRVMQVLDLLRPHGTGLLLALDEVHRTNVSELREITDVVAYAIAENAPLAFVAAGLPATINKLVNDDVSTYLRRAERIELKNFTADDTAVALRHPIEEAGRSIEADALAAAVEASENYPYLVQLIGDFAWEAAAEAPVITAAHVAWAVEQARPAMFRQIHEPTLAGLSDRDRDYIFAMSVDDGPSLTRDIAARLGVTIQHAGVYRSRLIIDGVIMEAGRGRVEFAIPYLRDYLRQAHSR